MKLYNKTKDNRRSFMNASLSSSFKNRSQHTTIMSLPHSVPLQTVQPLIPQTVRPNGIAACDKSKQLTDCDNSNA